MSSVMLSGIPNCSNAYIRQCVLAIDLIVDSLMLLYIWYLSKFNMFDGISSVHFQKRPFRLSYVLPMTGALNFLFAFNPRLGFLMFGYGV